MHNYKKHEEHCERAQQTIISFDILQRKCLQDKVLNEKKRPDFVIISQNTIMKRKIILFPEQKL